MRNFYHILIGFTIMYIIGSLTDFSTFTDEGKIIGVPLASAIIGVVIGGAWEWLQAVLLKAFFDFKDVIRTGLGTLLGGLFSVFIPDNEFIAIPLAVASFLLLLADLSLMFFNKKK